MALRSLLNVSMRPDQPRRKLPEDVIWLIAAASIVAPILGIILSFIGLAMLARGEAGSGWWIGGGAALIVIDYLTDIWLHRITRDACDEPQLNARGNKYIGRQVALELPITSGRGRVRIGDSWWSVEGPDIEAGVCVRIVAVRGAVLIVERM